jgi:acyl-CoA reductase-like NAD-dependent aldehyde dehydrogenase
MSAAAKIAPVLAAGCPIVFKPASETPLDVFVLADAAEAAGIPPGVLNIVPGDADVGAAIVAHPGVDRVLFTGSTTAGRAIAAASAGSMKRLTWSSAGRRPRSCSTTRASRVAAQHAADVVLQQRPGVHRTESGARAARQVRRSGRGRRRDRR